MKSSLTLQQAIDHIERQINASDDSRRPSRSIHEKTGAKASVQPPRSFDKVVGL